MLFYKINDDGLALELHVLEHHPRIEIDGEYVDDPKYISEPIPNDIFVSSDYPAKWTGEEWVATGVEPKPQPQVPTEIDLLQAQVQASSDYVDLLEEVVVELIQEVYK